MARGYFTWFYRESGGNVGGKGEDVEEKEENFLNFTFCRRIEPGKGRIWSNCDGSVH